MVNVAWRWLLNIDLLVNAYLISNGYYLWWLVVMINDTEKLMFWILAGELMFRQWLHGCVMMVI